MNTKPVEKEGGGIKSSPKKLLIVDDEQDQLKIFTIWAVSFGYECISVRSAKEAMTILQSTQIDIVVSDMMMPDIDGMELLKFIKESYPDTDVIIVTGFSRDSTFSEVINAGAVEFLEKPISKDVFAGKLKRVSRERELRLSYEQEIQTQKVLSSLLRLSIKKRSLKELLQEFIETISAFPWLELEARGAVFLVDENANDQLVLEAQHNLSDPLKTICATVPFGKCLCGKAALSKEVVFAEHIDDRHDNTFLGIRPHGHYCVPIKLSADQLLGVFTLYTREGAARDLRVESILSDAASTVASIIKHHKDEEAIRESEEVYKAFSSATIDALVMVDEKGLISLWNPAAEKIFGYSSREAIGLDLYTLLAIQVADRKDHADLRNIAGGGDDRFIGKTIEVLAKDKNGREVPSEVSLARVSIKGNIHAVGVFRDISTRKKEEREKERLNWKLKQAQKMEAIGTLAGGIAHDFNNILAAILGFAAMAKDDLEPGSQVFSDLERIISAGNRAKDLVRQILTFSRQTDVERVPVNIKLILKEALKLLRASIPANIEFSQNISEDQHLVLADPAQLHQVIMNLCTNAYYAMKDEGGRLGIKLNTEAIDTPDPERPDLSPGKYVKMVISDNGPGIPPDIMEHIFEPYFTTKPIGEGTGMGLSTVHGIVGELGGLIAVDSKLGEGTSAIVYLPMVEDGGADISDSSGEQQTDNLGSEHIMVVDDEVSLVEVLTRMLEKTGYTVAPFVNSLKALEAFSHSPQTFDMVITDQAMPGMTGLELAGHLRSIRPDVPIFIVTGFNDRVSIEYSKKLGISNVFHKPVAFKQLLTQMRQTLEGRDAI